MLASLSFLNKAPDLIYSFRIYEVCAYIPTTMWTSEPGRKGTWLNYVQKINGLLQDTFYVYLTYRTPYLARGDPIVIVVVAYEIRQVRLAGSCHAIRRQVLCVVITRYELLE